MTSRRLLAPAAIVSMVLSSISVTAWAQRPRTGVQDSVPRALAEALMSPSFHITDITRDSDGGRPRLMVGTLPPPLAERLWIPPEVEVLGGVQSTNTGVAFLRSGLALDNLAAAYRREQASRGWTAAAVSNSSPFWGFVPATPGPEKTSEHMRFCSGDTVLTIHVASLDERVREITASLSTVGTACRASLIEREPWRAMQQAFHPTLITPPESGVGRRIDCADWSMSRGGGETQVSTPLSVEEVLAHYGAQLADSGWALAAADEMVTRTWTRRDSTGVFVDVTLTARRRPRAQRCVEVEMRVGTRTVR